MADTLAQPDTGVRPDRAPPNGTSRWQLVVGILGLVVALWVGSELYDVVFFDGVGPGPGQDTPVENQDPAGDPTPTGSVPHDPSQFDHG